MQQTYVFGYVSGDGKDYTLPCIKANRVERLRNRLEAKGATLTIRGEARPLAPAAAPIIKPSLNRTEGLGPVKKADPLTRRGTNPELPKTTGPTPRPVINLTTGQYFASAGDAASAIGAATSTVMANICGSKPHAKRNLFRYANPAEVEAKKMLHPVNQ